VAGQEPSQDNLTIRQAAALLGLHPNTIRHRIKAGVYKAEKIVTKNGFTYFIDRASLGNHPPNKGPTSALQRAPNNLVEVPLTDLQDFVLEVVRDAATLNKAESEEEEKLERTRQGMIESLKLEHATASHIGTICLAAIAAFSAMLGGVFSDPKDWDSKLQVINAYPIITFTVDRTPVIFFIMGTLLIAAVGSLLASVAARAAITDVAKAANMLEMEEVQDELTSLKHRRVYERLAGIAFFGIAALAFLLFISQSTNT
jgi:hypothetical protein